MKADRFNVLSLACGIASVIAAIPPFVYGDESALPYLPIILPLGILAIYFGRRGRADATYWSNKIAGYIGTCCGAITTAGSVVFLLFGFLIMRPLVANETLEAYAKCQEIIKIASSGSNSGEQKTIEGEIVQSQREAIHNLGWADSMREINASYGGLDPEVRDYISSCAALFDSFANHARAREDLGIAMRDHDAKYKSFAGIFDKFLRVVRGEAFDKTEEQIASERKIRNLLEERDAKWAIVEGQVGLIKQEQVRVEAALRSKYNWKG